MLTESTRQYEMEFHLLAVIIKIWQSWFLIIQKISPERKLYQDFPIKFGVVLFINTYFTNGAKIDIPKD